MEAKTNINYFSKIDGREIILKDCSLLREFIYCRRNFALLEKNNYYWVCVNGEKDKLYSIWSISKLNGEETMAINAILSCFRREYDKNNITNDLIDKFLKNPLKTTLLKIKKKRKKCKD